MKKEQQSYPRHHGCEHEEHHAKEQQSYRRHHGCEHEEQHAEEQHGGIVVNFACFIACN
jgi:hypothetical protein